MQVVRQLVSLQTKLRAAVASKKRATTTTTAPQPLGADDLRRVSGGTESSPVKGW